MKILVACEFTGTVRRALRARGHDAWSCDLLPAEDGSPHHIQCDVRKILRDGWDGMVAHPTCTRLANSGVRWLHERDLWADLDEAAEFYCELRDAPIEQKGIENPVFHRYARERINPGPRQIVQPWWFGDPFFKATGFELIGLPPLVPTNKLVPPAKGTDEYKKWSKVHRTPPGPNRWKERSRTFPGLASAIAAQWFTGNQMSMAA